MTVKELAEILDDQDADLEVLIRPNVPGYDLDAGEFRIAFVTRTLERDTAEPVIVIECDQQE
jgi:hypothetical protein